MLVFLTKSSISSAYNMCFVVTAEYFPLQFSSQVFGYCNMIGRITTILAPIVAELDFPVPLLYYGVVTFCTTLATSMLEKS